MTTYTGQESETVRKLVKRWKAEAEQSLEFNGGSLLDVLASVQPMGKPTEQAQVFFVDFTSSVIDRDPFSIIDGKWGGLGGQSWFQYEGYPDHVYETDHKGGWLQRWVISEKKWEREFDPKTAPAPIPKVDTELLLGDFGSFQFPSIGIGRVGLNPSPRVSPEVKVPEDEEI